MRPQTNGMVERFNGRIEDVLQSHRFRSGEDLEQTLLRYVRLYNGQLPQSVLKGRTPIDALKDWHQEKPELFRKKPYNHTGCDRLHMSMDRSKVNKMVAGTRAISASELIAISEITGHPMPTQKAAGLSESDEAYVTSPDIQRNAKDPRGVFSHLKHNDVAVTIRGKTLIVNAAVDKKNIPRLRRMIDAMEKLMDDD